MCSVLQFPPMKKERKSFRKSLARGLSASFFFSVVEGRTSHWLQTFPFTDCQYQGRSVRLYIE